VNLLALGWQEMCTLVSELNWPAYRASQILRWLYRSRVTEIDQMTDLSIADRCQLKSMATILRSPQAACIPARDGTQKYVFALPDGLQVESVLIPEGRRLTLCLSTQVGCTLDCSFCLTGKMGLKRNLQAHEIVQQVLTVQDHLQDHQSITSLVFMGMGEPLANIDQVSGAVGRLTNTQWGMGFSPRRITLSTAGLITRFKEVAKLGINLAVSLNATTDEQRNQLMPAANALYPLDQLLQTCRDYPLGSRRRLTFEYVLLAGVNDTIGDAHRLRKLLKGIHCKVNLIPFNAFPDSPYGRPDEDVILRFQAVLRQAGSDVFIRKSRGREVLGACGQLGHLES
ncbi:MAG: 23S rRNA (adenine(2503)-C(2))-methyltransferase RlmN, partial [Nitrospirota bacterium]